MITTDDPNIAVRLRRFRHHGMTISDVERHESKTVIIEEYPEIGYNYRMTDIQAAIGIEQLKRLPFIIERRRQIAEVYNREFKGIKSIKAPPIPDYAFHNYQSYWIELLDSAPVSRDALMQKPLDKGISLRRGIMAIHLEECYSKYKVSLPETGRITKNTVIIPLFPSMTEEEQGYVVHCIRDILL